MRSCLCLCVFAFYDEATTHTLFAHIDKLNADVPWLRLGSAGVARSSMMVLMYSTTSPAMVGPSRVQSCSSTSVSRVVSHSCQRGSLGLSRATHEGALRGDHRHTAPHLRQRQPRHREPAHPAHASHGVDPARRHAAARAMVRAVPSVRPRPPALAMVVPMAAVGGGGGGQRGAARQRGDVRRMAGGGPASLSPPYLARPCCCGRRRARPGSACVVRRPSRLG